MVIEKNLDLVRRTYDRAARGYNEIVEGNHSYPEQLDLLVTKLKPHSRVLDVGCGTGEAIGYLMKKGIIGTGIDFSKSMLEIARKRFPEGEFFELDFGKDIVPSTYDAFIAYLSLVYTPPDQLPELLKKISLSLEGRKLFQIAMLTGDDSLIDQNFWDTGEPMYFISYTEEELVNIVRNLGFELLDVVTKVNQYKNFEEQTIYITGRVP